MKHMNRSVMFNRAYAFRNQTRSIEHLMTKKSKLIFDGNFSICCRSVKVPISHSWTTIDDQIYLLSHKYCNWNLKIKTLQSNIVGRFRWNGHMCSGANLMIYHLLLFNHNSQQKKNKEKQIFKIQSLCNAIHIQSICLSIRIYSIASN